MKIDRDRTQVVARFTPREARALAEKLEAVYTDHTDPEKSVVNWDMADLIWDLKMGLHESSEG